MKVSGEWIEFDRLVKLGDGELSGVQRLDLSGRSLQGLVANDVLDKSEGCRSHMATLVGIGYFLVGIQCSFRSSHSIDCVTRTALFGRVIELSVFWITSSKDLQIYELFVDSVDETLLSEKSVVVANETGSFVDNGGLDLLRLRLELVELVKTLGDN